jgi:4-amino-4-deoxy-L-arabinose transferase-like glycosyltransferase
MSRNTGQPITAGGSANERWILYAILAVSLVLSLLFAMRVPLENGSNPDEIAHFEYVKLIVQNRGLVVFKPNDVLWSETHQPPLYYLLCAPFYALSGGSLVVVRMVAALIQLATITFAYRASKALFPSRPEMALGAAAFVAFLPTQAQLSGAVNNDSLTTLISVLIFWKLGRLAQRGMRWEGALLLGGLFGLGICTKLTVIQLLPAFVVAYVMAIRAGKITLPAAVKSFAIVLGVGLLVASPVLIRNTMLYGDPLTLKIFPQTAPSYTPTPARMMEMMPGLFGSMADYLRVVALRTYASFWFIVPPNVLIPPTPTFVVVILLGLLGLVGSLRGTERGGVGGDERRVVVLSLATVTLLIPFFVRFILQFFQAQGRYFLPALLPVALIACIGWGNLFGPERRGSAVGIVAFLLLALSAFQISLYG